MFKKVEGTGKFTVTAGRLWINTEDAFSLQQGTLLNSATLQIDGGHAVTLKANDLSNEGTFRTSTPTLALGSTLKNTGAMEFSADGIVSQVQATGDIRNTGTIRKTAGGGTSQIDVPVLGGGNFDVQTGTIALTKSVGTDADRVALMTKSGSGVLVIDGPQHYAAPTSGEYYSGGTFYSYAGKTIFRTDAGEHGQFLYVSGMDVQFDVSQHLRYIRVEGGSKYKLTPSAIPNGKVLDAEGVLAYIYPSLGSVWGQIDLTNNAYEGGSASHLLYYGYGDGRWDGQGIISSTAAGEGKTLGYVNDGGVTTIKYTYAGDVNLDGSVTEADRQVIHDLIDLAAGHPRPGATYGGWNDFNYTGAGGIEADMAILMANLGSTPNNPMWSGSELAGYGNYAPAPGSTLWIGGSSTSAPMTLTARTLNNAGTAVWTGTTNVTLANGSSINNTGMFDIRADASLTGGGTGGASFVNAGTLRKSAGAGTFAIGPNVTLVNNGGTIDVQTGTLAVQGPVQIASGTTLTKAGGGTLALPSLVVGDARTNGMTQTGGTVQVAGELIVGRNGAAGVGNGAYTLAGGTLETSVTKVGDYWGTGTFTQTGGTYVISPAGWPYALYVGNWGGNGTYNLQGGDVTGRDLQVGNGATGLFHQTGGTNSVYWTEVGPHNGAYSNGTYVLDGGTFVSHVLTIGNYYNGRGRFEMNGGTAYVNGVELGMSGSGGVASMTINDGTYQGTNLYSGSGSVTTVEINGGTVDIAASWTAPGGNALYAQSGGTVTYGQLRLTDGIARYELSGGAIHVTSTFTIGATAQLEQWGGALTAGSVVNDGTIEWSGGSITAEVTNNGTFNLRGGGTLTVNGNVVNNGTIKTWDTNFAYTGTFTNNGTYVSDPADNFFANLVVTDRGALVGGVGDRFIVSGDLQSNSGNNAGWQTVEAQLLFTGGEDGTHAFDVTGADLGATGIGFADNFAWGVLTVGIGETLTLLDGNDVAGAGLYIRELDLSGGLAQLASLHGNGVNVYYDVLGNTWLDGQSYALIGGGSLIPINSLSSFASLASVPEPASAALVALGGLVLTRRRR